MANRKVLFRSGANLNEASVSADALLIASIDQGSTTFTLKTAGATLYSVATSGLMTMNGAFSIVPSADNAGSIGTDTAETGGDPLSLGVTRRFAVVSARLVKSGSTITLENSIDIANSADGVGAASEGRIKYESATQALRVSENGAALDDVVLRTKSQTLTTKTLTTPTIASFTNATHNHQAAAGGGTLDHGLATTGLTDDDHTQYALLAGRAAGQTLIGGTANSENLVLQSTASATRGFISATDQLRTTSTTTLAAFRAGSFAGDPSSLADGDVWYNSSTGKFRGRQAGASVDIVDGPVGGGWTDDGTVVRLTTSTDNVTIGSASQIAKFGVVGDTDEVQCTIRGNATQTNTVFRVETSGSGTLFTVSNAGAVVAGSSITTTALINGGSYQVGATTVIDTSRNLVGIVNLAQSLSPEADGTRDLGTSSLRYNNIVGNNFRIFNALGDSLAATYLFGTSLYFGPGGASGQDVGLSRGAAGVMNVHSANGATAARLDVTNNIGGASVATEQLRLTRTTGGTAAAGLGAYRTYSIENDGAANIEAFREEVTWISAVAGATNARVKLQRVTAGASLVDFINASAVSVDVSSSGIPTNILGTLQMGGVTVIGTSGRVTAISTTTLPGVNVGSFAGDPSSLANGDAWYNSSTNKFRARENGVTLDIIGGPVGGGWTDDGTSVRLTTSTDSVGIGVSTPDRKLEILDSAAAQLRLTHTDASVYADFRAESTGDLTLAPTNNRVTIGTPSSTQKGFHAVLANSAGGVTIQARNTDNTASAFASCVLSVGGASALDPYTYLTVTGVTEWSYGIDNSDSDAFVFSEGSGLGTNNRFRIATGGAADFYSTLTVAGKLITTSTTTTPAVLVGSFAGDPSSLADGDVWYNSSTGKFRGRQAGASVDVVGAGPTLGQVLALSGGMALP